MACRFPNFSAEISAIVEISIHFSRSHNWISNLLLHFPNSWDESWQNLRFIYYNVINTIYAQNSQLARVTTMRQICLDIKGYPQNAQCYYWKKCRRCMEFLSWLCDNQLIVSISMDAMLFFILLKRRRCAATLLLCAQSTLFGTGIALVRNPVQIAWFSGALCGLWREMLMVMLIKFSFQSQFEIGTTIQMTRKRPLRVKVIE